MGFPPAAAAAKNGQGVGGWPAVPARLPALHPAAPALPPPLQQHYCIAVGVKDSTGLLQRFGLPHYSPAAALPPGVQQLAPWGVRQRPRPPPRFML